MRTKTLLLTAVVAAAGLASSMAQVYSVNVVGYVSTPLVAGQNALVSNPLNNGTNTLNDLVGSLPAKSSAQLWNGAGYTPSLKGATWSPNLPINPAQGFFLKPSSASVWVQTMP